MLRRKLLARIGLLIGVFVVGAVVAVVLLQRVVFDVERVNVESTTLVESLQSLDAAIETLDGHDDLVAREQAVATMRGALAGLQDHDVTRAPDGAASATLARLEESLAPILAGEPGPVSAPARDDVRTLNSIIAHQLADERAGQMRHFRRLVLGLTIAAIVMVNISVVVLLRVVQMILRPVDELTAASHELAKERFGHRVSIDADDEFGELAHVFNRMATQLEANEELKMETLRQVAAALNHGLNNAISTIELQLTLANRDARAEPQLKERLERIHQILAGMTEAVHALTNVRRIVLTEYVPGQLMLDLKRSVEAEPSEVAGSGDAEGVLRTG